MLDGVHLGEHLLVVALGVTDDGTKVPLGVVEGSTENAHVCVRLIADLVDRGLDASRGVLFVIDGGKALSKAIRAAFGDKALIQRCRRHKERHRTPARGRTSADPTQAPSRLGQPRQGRRRARARGARTGA